MPDEATDAFHSMVKASRSATPWMRSGDSNRNVLTTPAVGKIQITNVICEINPTSCPLVISDVYSMR